MNLLLIPIAAFLGIVALLILKEIKPDTIVKKLIKVGIILLFVAIFLVISYYMKDAKGY
jgi:hypothetical protein